jgi:hypothetical protein
MGDGIVGGVGSHLDAERQPDASLRRRHERRELLEPLALLGPVHVP